jgi:quercetin dioxygenase-like cupin family protein
MIEKLYSFSSGDHKVIERIVEDDYVAINHMILGKADALPEHYANSHVSMLVIRGTVTLRLDDQAEHQYPAGSIIAIPYRTKMNVSNQHAAVLEFFVIKAPAPHTMAVEKN